MPAARPARLLAAVAVALALPACSGSSCQALPDLRAERDAARTAYDALLRTGTAGPQESEQADEDVHLLDRQVYDLEQTC